MALAPGDIAFVQYNADGTDNFAFVALTDIAQSEPIRFTDNGWLGDDSGFRSGEGVITWTPPPGGVAAGTIVEITSAPTASTGSSVETGSFNFAGTGDQVIAYQDGGPSIVPIAALQNDGAGAFSADATSAQTSALPLGLVVGTSAIALNEIDNAAYDGPTTGSKALLQQELNNSANWTSASDTVNQTFAGTFKVVANDKLLLSEIVVTPTAGEFIEIHNPHSVAVDLTDIYLTDATFAGGSNYYYNIVTGTGAGGGGFGDFLARFPNGATIAAGEYLTISLSGSDDFFAEYGVNPDFELFEDGATADAVADMVEPIAGSINMQGGLTNGGEVAVLFEWDGTSDLVIDHDYAIWGDTAEAVDKTGVTVDGPDGDTDTSAYLDDTAIASQEIISASAHADGNSYQRIDLTEGTQTATGGNGVGGTDETSENLGTTWASDRAVSPGAAAPAAPPPPVVTTVTIDEIQGSGATSPLDGDLVETTAIVVGDYDDDGELSGFFLQMPDAEVDADAQTSAGIFVFVGDASVAVDNVAEGDEVRVVGTVSEFFGQTQIGSISELEVVSTGNIAQVTPVTVSLPAAGGTYEEEATYEAFEGMSVTFNQTLVVSEFFELARYGQIVLTQDDVPLQFTQDNAPDVAGYAAYLDEIGSKQIILDDASNFQNASLGTPNTPYAYPEGGLSLTNFFRGGDSIDGLTGVLSWSFSGTTGTDAWRIRPIEAEDYSFTVENPRDASPDSVGGNFKVASLNVLNFFTTIDDGVNNARGADSTAELARQTDKLVAALVEMDADILGLTEIENDFDIAGNDTAIEALVAALNAATAPGTYAFVDPGRDLVDVSDAISTAMIYKTANVMLTPGTTVDILDDARIDALVAAGADPAIDPGHELFDGDGTNRASLAATFTDIATGQEITVSTNHFKSKGSISPFGNNTDIGDGAANNNEARVQAARAVDAWLDTNPTGSTTELKLILGDLNAYASEDPVTLLEGEGYTNLAKAFGGPEAYSYRFDGQLGTLDYALSSSALTPLVTGATEWHINADEIPLFDYNDEILDAAESFFEEESDALPIFAPDAFRSSDHDPIIIGLQLDPVVLPNDPPSIALTTVTDTLPEDTDVSGRIKLADVVITDDGNGTNNLSIRGADSGSFELDGLELFLAAGADLDFEREEELTVFVDVDDPDLGTEREDSATFTLTLTDVNEAPAVTLENASTSLAEDTDTSTRIKIADIEIDDDALGTNDLALTGTDAALFEIDGLELFLSAGAALDFELQAQLDVGVSIDDTTVGTTPDDSAALAIAITDVNEPPLIEVAATQDTVDEASFIFSRIKLADIAITDDALGDETLGLSGPNANLFQLEGSELFLRAGFGIDFEATPTLPVTITLNDPTIGTSVDDTVEFVLNIGDVNEAPTAFALDPANGTLPEDTDTTERVKVADIIVTDDALGEEEIALSGSDAALFEVDGLELFVVAGTPLDFETDNGFDVTLTFDDPTLGDGPEGQVDFALEITDSNDPPSVALINQLSDLAEDTDTSARIKVADIVVTDDATGINDLSLSGTDAAAFEIDGSELFLTAGAVLDFETAAALNVNVEVDDAGVGSSPDDAVAFALAVTDVNEAPSVALANAVTTLDEDADTSSALKVADIVVSDDALGTNALSLSGSDADSFEILGTELFLTAGTELDFETATSLDVTVQIDDPEIGTGAEDSASLTIAIQDVSEPPTVSFVADITALDEDADTSARIKLADVTAINEDGSAPALSLAGADAGLFELDGNELFLAAGATLDFETSPTLSVSVEADDASFPGTPDVSATFDLAVNDVNEAPTVTLENALSELAEDADTSTRIKAADIVVSDDALGTTTLALAGAAAASFEIDGDVLYLKAGTTLDFETLATLEVSVTVDDPAFGATPDDTASYTLNITDVNELPTLSLSNVIASVAEDADTSQRIKVADIDVSDDAIGTATLGLTGDDAALFEIDGTELFLSAGAALDFETQAALNIAVTADDPTIAGSPDALNDLTLQVTDVNEAPSVTLENVVALIGEGAADDDPLPVADIVITDDATGTNTISLSGADADLFEVSGSGLFLRRGSVLDATAMAQLSVDVIIDDPAIGTGTEASATFTASVADTQQTGGADDDNLLGTSLNDTLDGGGGDDTLEGGGGDDMLIGGPGDGDTAQYSGDNSGYRLILSDDLITLTDLGATGNGTDVLEGVEVLSFPDATNAPNGGDVDLDAIDGAVDVTADGLVDLIQLYLAYFDRAPDAFGLLFWASALADGVAIEEIAQLFYDQPETDVVFPDETDNEALVDAAYDNLLEREGQTPGRTFWLDLLDDGTVAKEDFMRLFLEGALNNQSAVDDLTTIADKTDIGISYAVIEGLTDVGDAFDVMALYDTADRPGSLADAQTAIEGHATDAAGNELTVSLLGVLDDPFLI